MKIAFYTLGCKVNSYETESVWEQFERAGFERVPFHEFADVYVINTCTVTNQSDVKSRKTIRRAIRQNPDAVVAVMGCYAQMDPDTVAEIDGVVIVIGTKHRAKLFELVMKVVHERRKYFAVGDVLKYRKFDELQVTHYAENTRAFLKIEDGCNQFCTYCIIPFARGPVRSRAPKNILHEARELVKNGYKEIVLTGIHTGAYGVDLENYNLKDLLKDLLVITGLERIRISSIEINEITDEILYIMASSNRFAWHLHIPLQNGSDEILRKMRRKYTVSQFKDRIKEIREILPGIAITTDVIVGFPGESEAHFKENIDSINQIGFSELHVFPYSRRSGTKAATMPGQIDGVTKTFRVNQLLALNEKLATRFISSKKKLSVLFERSDEHYTYGHSSDYIAVKTEKNEDLHNQIVLCDIVTFEYGNVIVKPNILQEK